MSTPATHPCAVCGGTGLIDPVDSVPCRNHEEDGVRLGCDCEPCETCKEECNPAPGDDNPGCSCGTADAGAPGHEEHES